MSHNITVESGKSLKLKTAGKYCDRDIVVTAEGGSGMVVCEKTEVTGDTTIRELGELHLSIPNATSIGSQAFIQCHNLASIDLPIATIINQSAFTECHTLTSINAPLLVSIRDNAFVLCKSLKSVNFPMVSYVGENAFGDCHSLQRICLPNATDILGIAFSDCRSLTKVDLPKATNIGSGAFLRDTNLQAVILRTTETVCAIDIGAFAIDIDENGMPTIINDKFYIPSSMYEHYRSAYEPAFEEYGFGGYFDIIFHKIEDYPEITGG